MRDDFSKPVVGMFEAFFKLFGALYAVWMVFCFVFGLLVLGALGYAGYTILQWIQADTARIEAGR